jgi:hypothetical protein
LTHPTFYQNGTNTTPASAPTIGAAGAVPPGITIGSLPDGYNGQCFWNGDISEVLVYDHQLTSSEQATIYQYL